MIDEDLFIEASNLAATLAKSIDPYAVLDPNFPQQNGFIKDTARLKALFCTRRAAKSFTAGLYMVSECLRTPNVNCLFVGLTRDSAKGIIWKDVLQIINQKFDLGARPNLSELSYTFPNGSIIRVTGIDADQDEMNKLLGKKYKLVCIDEASIYTIDLEKLVYGILKPAVADQRGTICLMGTSSNFTRGLFYDITTGVRSDWSVHTWTAHDNPYVAIQWKEELEEIDRDRPFFKETPLFKQWYLNQWVVDTDKLVYKFNPDRNLFHVEPKLRSNGWTYFLGVDTGWEDDNAFVLAGFHEDDPNFYVLKTFNKPHMTFDAVVEKIQEFMNDKNYPISRVIIDGANKQGIESMRARSSIPFEYADKLGKVDFIEMMNGDLIQGKIKINASCTTLINQMMGLVWKTDGDRIIIPKKEHPALPNHLNDALLYNWRCGYHYYFQHIGPKAKKTDEEVAQEFFEHHASKLQKERAIKDGQQYGGWHTDDQGIPDWHRWSD